MSDDERIETAKECIRILTDRVIQVISIAANNEIVSYSDSVSSTIPESYAAHAFRTVQDSLYFFGLIRLMSLWDNAATNAISIPTAVCLLDKTSIFKNIEDDYRNWYANKERHHLSPNADAAVQMEIERFLQDLQNEEAKKMSIHTRLKLTNAMDMAKLTYNDSSTKVIKNLRDHLAHSLTKTRAELKTPVEQAKYGQEKELLQKSISIIQDLYVTVNGTSFDIAGEVFDQETKNARDFWESCDFNLKST